MQEIFAQKDVAHRIADTKAAQEMAALDDFYGMLTRDPERAFYGPGHVLAAAEQGAIATLLLSDSLYRCASRSSICTRWLLLYPLDALLNWIHRREQLLLSDSLCRKRLPLHPFSLLNWTRCRE